MTVNKGLKALAESDPDFSDQHLENAIIELRIGWVAKSIDLDTEIQNNSVLTLSQKNDLKQTINNIGYLNVGRYLGDMIRHTKSILDGSIVPGEPDIAVGENGQGTFVEILGLVQSIQLTIPNLYGTPASEFSRDVNDHLGILNNKFLTSEDSTDPVFTSLKNSITFINNGGLAQETALGTAIDNLKNFLTSVVGDSTDFQQTLNTFATAVASANTAFDTVLQAQPYGPKRTQMIADRNSVTTQIQLENTNLSGIRAYTTTLSNNSAFVGLADDPELRQLLATSARNVNWQNYFNDYESNKASMNPIYAIGTDSDKSSVIDQALQNLGLPDVTDYLNLNAVADKAKRDDRIDTKFFDSYTVDEIITKSCQQLNIATANRSIYNQSQSLLTNLNQHDRDKIAGNLDANESATTIS